MMQVLNHPTDLNNRKHYINASEYYTRLTRFAVNVNKVYGIYNVIRII